MDGRVLKARLSLLGDGYGPASTFRSDFTTGRPDGAAAYRDLHDDSGCGCFRYSGPLRRG